ncbi:ABC transporter ATP-binding protein [Microbacterium telephonicum]|uniref:Iron complex transport system ATP-binding protein n=1 Tax=Microbacterium telephonicum TaxID=1714841 RepID=A0A498C135_9MICO|nr:ABC transporter ATP-binding protein [Microbacterium telephonicum]RLK49584.1 iron complex transport system ATP-binding protein [Microbacterium telephonicum]
MTAQHTLLAEGLVSGYGGVTVVDGIDLTVPAGSISVIVGANACGKSTLLKTLARLIPAQRGTVVLDGTRIDQIPTKELARTLGLLPQQPVAPEGIAVADLVGRGRHPHQKLFRSWTAADDRAVAEALAATGVLELSDRAVDELSGGQRQRVWIAMALAQQTDVLLLDEPTTFLDVSHQIEVLDLLTDLNRSRGTTIVMVLHDINLAARYADHLFALRRGTLIASGAPAEVVTSELIRDVFDLDSVVLPDPVSGSPMVLPRGRHHVRPTPDAGPPASVPSPVPDTTGADR